MATKLEVLECLAGKGKDGLAVNQGVLVKEFGLTPSAACHWLSRLCGQGLIEHKPSPMERQRSWFLTDRGKERLEWLRKNPEGENPPKPSVWDGFFEGL